MTKISAFAQYFKFLRKKGKLGQKEVSGLLDIKLQSISNWEAGRFLPDAERLPMIRKKMSLQEDEFASLLAAWRLERAKIDDKKLSFFEKKEKEKRRNPSVIIPLYREGDTINPMAVPDVFEWLGLFVRKPLGYGVHPMCAFLLEDDSMSPTFQRGDILFFDLTLVKPEKGKPYIVCIKDRVYCRLLSRHVGSRYVFRQANQKSEPIIKDMKKIAWLYKVIHKQRLPTRMTKGDSIVVGKASKQVKKKVALS